MPYPDEERSLERREALLCLLYLMGDENYAVRSKQTYAPLAQFFELTHEEQFRKLDQKTNRDKWANLVQNSREDLAQQEYIHRGNRGIWQLTDDGVEEAATLLSKNPQRYIRLRQIVDSTLTYMTDNSSTRNFQLPEEVNGRRFFEGAVRQIVVNAYERNPEARKRCIEHYGAQCIVCGVDLGKKYGEKAEGLIHVHHLKPLSLVNTTYEVDPINDLRPVCPNCHAVIHRCNPPYTIEEVRTFLNDANQSAHSNP
jgi:5-methylcytosine-specific restriction enzyme A